MKYGDMERRIFGYVPMMADGGDGGGGGDGEGGDGGGGGDGGDGGEGGDGELNLREGDAADGDEGDGELNLREGDAADGDEGEGEGGEKPTEEQVQKLVDGIKPVDMGLGKDEKGNYIGWDAEAVKHMAPVFAKHGLDPAAAGELATAYAELTKTRQAAAVTADKNLNAQMVAASKKQFGNDLPVRLKEADIGGEAIYGKEFYAELRGIKLFANNPKAIEAHAAFGRKYADDGGAGGGDGGGDGGGEPDLAARMYPDT